MIWSIEYEVAGAQAIKLSSDLADMARGMALVEKGQREEPGKALPTFTPSDLKEFDLRIAELQALYLRLLVLRRWQIKEWERQEC